MVGKRGWESEAFQVSQKIQRNSPAPLWFAKNRSCLLFCTGPGRKRPFLFTAAMWRDQRNWVNKWSCCTTEKLSRALSRGRDEGSKEKGTGNPAGLKFLCKSL